MTNQTISNPFHSFTRALALGLVLLLAGTGCASTGGKPEGSEPSAAQQLIADGEQEERDGNNTEALVHYLSALKLEPSADLWYRIGRLKLANHEEPQALSAFSSAAGMDPNHAPSLEAIGLIYLKWRQNAPAQRALEQAVSADAGRWKAYNGLAILAALDGHFEAAIDHYDTALALNPHSADLLNNLGYAQFLRGTPDLAAQYLVDALKQRADHKVAWTNLAMVMARQGRYTDAFNILEQNYSTAIAYHDIGYIAMINGEYTKAEIYLTKALQASPRYFDEAHRNRELARNRLLGNDEGTFVARRDALYPYCIGLGEHPC